MSRGVSSLKKKRETRFFFLRAHSSGQQSAPLKIMKFLIFHRLFKAKHPKSDKGPPLLGWPNLAFRFRGLKIIKIFMFFSKVKENDPNRARVPPCLDGPNPAVRFEDLKIIKIINISEQNAPNRARVPLPLLGWPKSGRLIWRSEN